MMKRIKKLWFRVEAAFLLFVSDDFFLTCYKFKNKKRVEWKNYTTLPVKDGELLASNRVVMGAIELKQDAYQAKANIELAEELLKQ